MIGSMCVLLCLSMSLAAFSAAAEQGERVSVLVEGVHCDACLGVVRKQLAAFKGVKVEPDDIYRGEKPKYFSDPFVVRLGKTTETGLGALAKAAAQSRTPHAEETPPRLVLVLYTEDTIDEESVTELRMALAEVNGLQVFEGGGLGGVPNKSWYWIRLDPAGGAELKEITAAAKKAIRFQLLDPAGEAIDIILETAQTVCQLEREKFRLAGPPVDGVAIDRAGINTMKRYALLGTVGHVVREQACPVGCVVGDATVSRQRCCNTSWHRYGKH